MTVSSQASPSYACNGVYNVARHGNQRTLRVLDCQPGQGERCSPVDPLKRNPCKWSDVMTRKYSPKSAGRTHDLRIRLSDAEYAKLSTNAAVDNASMSSFMRSVLLDYVSSNRRPDGVVTALSALSRELSAVGNNLNQIAHVLNGGGSSDVTQTRNEIDVLKARVRKMLVGIRA